MQDLAKEKTMTVKEIAEVLSVSRELITQKVRELFPDKVKNGITTFLNEKEVVILKNNLVKKYEAKTDLEMSLNLIQIAKYFEDKYNESKKENELLRVEIKENQPKIDTYNSLIDSDGLYSMSNAAKALNTGRNRLFDKLRTLNILMKNNDPYQQFCDNGYFKIKYRTLKNNETISVTKVTPKGLIFLEKLLKKG